MNKMLLMMCLILLLCPPLHAEQPLLNQVERAQILQDEWVKQKPALKGAPVAAVQPSQVQKPIPAPGHCLPKEFSRTVTLRSAEASLSQVLRPLAKSIGYNLVLGPGVSDSKVNVDLEHISFDKALNDVLFPLGYGFKAQQGSLIILAQETRIFRIDLPPVVQNFEDLTSNESYEESQNSANNAVQQSGSSTNNQNVKLGTKVVVNNASTGISFWDDVVRNLKVLLSTGGQFSLNKPSGSVIVTDSPAVLEKVDAYFDDLNKRVSQQIEVDVKVVEVSLTNENDLGIDWSALAKNLKEVNTLSLATNFATQNFTSGNFLTFAADGPHAGSGITDNGVHFVLDALSKQGRVEVVSQPKVMILNNQVSVIQVGSTESYIDNSTVEVTQTGTITSVSTSQVQEGVTMRLLGNVVGDQIYLSVTPVVTTIDNIRSIKEGTTTIEAPQTTTKSINTLVKLTAGQTVAIGGLITSSKQKNKQGVPGLSQIPVLGRLFEYNQDQNNRSELVIFITPKKV